MKKLLLLLTITLLSIATSAQNNVNVDNYRFSFKERGTPAKKIEPRSFYYAPKYSFSRLVTQCMETDEMFEKLNIQGQRKVEDPADADIVIDLKMDPITIASTDIRHRVVEDKDKQGNVTKRTYYYWVDITYNTNARGILTLGDKTLMNYSVLTSMKNFTFKSDEYATSTEASNFWKSNSDILRERFTRELVSKFIGDLNYNMSVDYGFYVKAGSSLIKTINEKKHPENEPLRAMADELKGNFEALDGTNPLLESNIEHIITYFKDIPTRYTDPKLKADVRLRYVAYYNLARIYLFLDQPENVKQWAELLFENGHDKKDGERLTEDANKLAEYLNKTDIKVRQFEPDNFFPVEEVPVEEEVAIAE